MTIRFQLRCVWIILLALASFSGIAANIERRDIEFASGLIDYGLSDYAQTVVNQYVARHPDQKDAADLIQAQILIDKNQFKEARTVIEAMPASSSKRQSALLSLASAYYMRRDFENAKNVFKSFFDTFGDRIPEDTDLLRYYREGAYQYGQVLEQAGDLVGAVGAYEKYLATNPDKGIVRNLMADQVNLYLQLARSNAQGRREEWLKKAGDLCGTIEWGGLDLWFGHAIIGRANIELIQNDIKGARDVLEDNMSLLKEIDGMLKEQGNLRKLSPMAGARFMLGELYERQARQTDDESAAIKAYAKSLGEFYNVFVKYGDSDWGAEAGINAQRIKDILEDKYGKTVKIDIGNQQDKLAETQFRLANNLYAEKKYAQAAQEYITALNSFPEVDASVPGLGNLALCYAHLSQDLYVDVVVHYLAERFKGNEDAARSLLLAGKYYFDQKNEDRFMGIYGLYLDAFPDHDRAPAVMFTLAGMYRKKGDEEKALSYYTNVIRSYPKSEYFVKSLSRIAWDLYRENEHSKAAPALAAYVKYEQPGYDRVLAQFCLGDSYRKLDQFEKARKAFEKVIAWVAPNDSTYHTSEDVKSKNRDLLAKAVFFRADSLSRMEGEGPQQAVQVFSQFLQMFPDNQLAPKALNGLGRVQLAMEEFDAATDAFDRLAREYPDSEEGKSALFSLIRAAMEVGKVDVARDALGRMLQSPDDYDANEFNRVGQLMLDESAWQQAVESFKNVLEGAGERRLLERALFGLGRAYYELGQYGESIKHLEDLMTRYPKSGLFYEAKFMLGQGYKQLGRLKEATEAMSDVFKYADQSLLINKANYQLAQIQKQQNDLTGALGSLQRVALLANADDPEIRPIVRDCILEAIDLAMQLERYQDAIDSCDQYLQEFPDSENQRSVMSTRREANLKKAEQQIEEEAAPSE